MIGIVVSRANEASEHVGEHLLDRREWASDDDATRSAAEGGGTVHRSGPFELRTFEELHLHLDGVAAAFDGPDLVVFASRHSGDTGPLLTAHFTGNLGPAEYGGRDGCLATAAPAALDRVRSALDDHAPPAYETGIECTHHGPSDVSAPSLFVELGSGPDQWADPAGARAVARSILALADDDGADDPVGERTLVGFGGGHYARRFDRLLRETDWAVGHVAADWGLDAMGDLREHRDVIGQVFERSGAERAVLDGDRPDVAEVISSLGFEVVSETWARAVDGVDLDLVAALEGALVAVDEGLRFGEPARDGHHGESPGRAFEVVALPDELLAAARGVDRDRTRAAVEAHLLAFETAEGASVVAGRGAVVEPGAVDDLVDGLVALLEGKFDRVERDADAVVAHERAFDPGRARELGVPEGPAFGRLAGGEAVEVDGRTVEPTDVTVDRTRTFHLE